MSAKSWKRLIWAAFIAALVTCLAPGASHAGIYNSDSEVTYKEYWVPHSQFTGGFRRLVVDGVPQSVAEAGCPHTNPNGSWYLEPWPSRDVNKQICEKVIEFSIPDDFSGALRAEIYLDLWRNQVGQLAQFSFNRGVAGIPANSYRPKVGMDWSRTPWVGDIPLSHLKQGVNTMTIWTASGGYHIHDIALRIYFDDAHPLKKANGTTIVAPGGTLTSITAQNGTKTPGQGGDLKVNDNQLTLSATGTGSIKFVEFHGFYEGYDEDNNGVVRDRHNRGRNNWHPGGQRLRPPAAPLTTWARIPLPATATNTAYPGI